MKTVTAITFTLLGVLALSTTPGQACIHAPEGFKGYVDSASQRGLIFFDAGREELVIQPAYTINTTNLDKDEYSDDGMLKNFDAFAWVVPLPSLPDAYKEADPAVFTDLAKFTEVAPRVPKIEKDNDEEDSGPIVGYDKEADVVFFKTLEVGDYTIQPIKAKGDAGGKELAAWLDDNGFGELDERVLRYYLANEVYWLAVKLSVKGGLPADGSAKPLQISFKTPKPVYPYKIYDKRGAFDLELWLVTRDAVDLTKTRKFGIETPEQANDSEFQKNRDTSYVKLPESARLIADSAADLKQLRTGKVFVYRFTGRNIDADEGLDLALLQEDLSFEFEKDTAPKPKDEVKPTPPPEEEKEGEGDKPEGEEGKK